MNLAEFLTREKGKKLIFPDKLNIFSKKDGATNWTSSLVDKSIILKGTYKNTDFTYDLEEFLETCLAPSNSMISVHNAVIEHFQNNNRFLDGLPLFIIRR